MEEYLGTVPLRIFTTARQQVTPPHLDVLFMATATIVVEANEAVSGPLSVQFLTKRKVSFFLPPPLLPPSFPSMLLSFFLSGHYYFHLCAIGKERGGGTQSLNQENGHNGDGRGEGVC